MKRLSSAELAIRSVRHGVLTRPTSRRANLEHIRRRTIRSIDVPTPATHEIAIRLELQHTTVLRIANKHILSRGRYRDPRPVRRSSRELAATRTRQTRQTTDGTDLKRRNTSRDTKAPSTNEVARRVELLHTPVIAIAHIHTASRLIDRNTLRIVELTRRTIRRSTKRTRLTISRNHTPLKHIPKITSTRRSDHIPAKGELEIPLGIEDLNPMIGIIGHINIAHISRTRTRLIHRNITRRAELSASTPRDTEERHHLLRTLSKRHTEHQRRQQAHRQRKKHALARGKSAA